MLSVTNAFFNFWMFWYIVVFGHKKVGSVNLGIVILAKVGSIRVAIHFCLVPTQLTTLFLLLHATLSVLPYNIFSDFIVLKYISSLEGAT